MDGRLAADGRIDPFSPPVPAGRVRLLSWWSLPFCLRSGFECRSTVICWFSTTRSGSVFVGPGFSSRGCGREASACIWRRRRPKGGCWRFSVRGGRRVKSSGRRKEPSSFLRRRGPGRSCGTLPTVICWMPKSRALRMFVGWKSWIGFSLRTVFSRSISNLKPS